MTTNTDRQWQAAKRFGARLGVTPEEYLRRRAAGLRGCPACKRWRPAREHGTQSRCRPCQAAHAVPGRVRTYRARTARLHGGKCPVPGYGDHHVYLDDREGPNDVLVMRCPTRADAEREVRERNAAALASGVGPLRAPLYYCVSPNSGEGAE